MLHRNSKRFIFFAVAALMISACADESTQRSIDRPGIKSAQRPINIKASNDELIYGDTIRFEVQAASSEFAITGLRVSMADTRQVLANSSDGSIVLPTIETGGGNVKLRIDATFEDGQSSMRFKDFDVLAADAPKIWALEVQNRFPHDKGAFTQGLLFHEGYLYEGTGNLGESRIRQVDMKTGEVLRERVNKADIFGEGITIFENKLYQLTYKTAKGYIYNLDDFEPLKEFTYNTWTGEGWGLTHNDTSLIISDGSAYLYFLDPETFEEKRRIRVFDDRGDVARLNELEYSNGLIYANIYTTAEIVAIDAGNGIVVNRYSARGVVDRAETTPNMDVLNGIAINPLNGNLLITGKYWPRLYEVKPVMK